MSGLFYCVAGGPLGLDSKLFFVCRDARPAPTGRAARKAARSRHGRDFERQIRIESLLCVA